MTVQHLLSFSSGLRWTESYEKTTHIHQSDVITMLFSSARQDILSFVINHPLEKKPGSQWYYSSGDTNLLTGILHHIYHKKDSTFPFTKLLNPIGISTASWQQDGKGVYIGSSDLYITPRDLARFGYLFLKKGRWNKTQLFDSSWVETSISTPQDIQHYKNKKTNTYPAHHWWVNSRKQNNKTYIKWPHVPADAYYAFGHHGQVVLVIPSTDIVIVKTANDRDRRCDHNQLFRMILNYINSTTLT